MCVYIYIYIYITLECLTNGKLNEISVLNVKETFLLKINVLIIVHFSSV